MIVALENIVQCMKSWWFYTGRKGPSAARPELLNSILDYLIFYHFRSIWDICGGGSDLQNAPSNTQKKEMYLMLYEEIVERTSKLCAQWQGVGFCHGVLNTDNMSMLGLTIDYGPYGWLDRYDMDVCLTVTCPAAAQIVGSLDAVAVGHICLFCLVSFVGHPGTDTIFRVLHRLTVLRYCSSNTP